MASITVDIQAKVVGYELSLKALLAAFAKVDPGSDIGKKLGTAIENAKRQLADLSKNMFPKASSDSQIDAIAERVNRVGVALLNVSNMFLNLNFGDLNLSALSPLISSAVSEMKQLLNVVDETMNGGIRLAVANSEELSSVFKDLGVNMKTLTALGGSDILSKGLADAEQLAEKAVLAYDKIAKRAEVSLEKLNKILSSAYSSKNFNKEEVFGKLTGFNDPTRIINEKLILEMRDRVSEVFANFKGQGSANSERALQMINDFLGIDNINTMKTVDDFRAKFEELCNLLRNLGFTNLGIIRILGSTKGENVFDKIFNLDEAGAETKLRLNSLMESFYTTFNFNNLLQKIIKDLIDKDQFLLAVEEAKRIIEEGYKKINKAEEKAIETNDNLAGKLSTAQRVKDTAEDKRDSLSRASETYSKIESELKAKVQTLENRIAVLENTILQLTLGELGKILSGTLGAGANAGKHSFPLGEALAYSKELTKINSALTFVGKLQGVTLRWFSVYAAVRMVSNAIKKIISNTKELDATITEIAIVTNKSQDDLWGLMPQYIDMAKKYGASISGAYKVSLLYYQLGLGLSDVMALSELTLKMARISGLDYAQATDYMTNAVRSFKLEMTDAASVVDTYSAVAAASATSVTELATAMSKTASSAQSVGSSLLNTTAMMAVMIEATRESPENIGSAMKSIISRYGELKENKTGIDEEGEEYSLNKVDTALLSVGISIHDAKGEFRDFDDVIFELADHWNEIDKNTQRYIATVMAGNRQQSRFLALVSSAERLRELSETATDSEDASQMQYLKTLDSIEYKSQLLKTSLLSLYANEGVLNLIKDTLDSITNIIDSFNNMSTAFNTPIAAIAKFGVLFANIAHIVTTTFGLIKTGVAALIDAIRSNGIAKALQAANEEVAIIKNKYTQEEEAAMHSALVKEGIMSKGMSAELANAYAAGKLAPLFGSTGDLKLLTFGQKLKQSFGKGGRGLALAGLGASILGSTLTMGAMGMSENTQDERNAKALKNGLGSILTGVGMGSMFGPWGMLAGGVVGLVSGIIEGQKIKEESDEERAERLKKELETAKNENISKKSEFKSLKSTIDEYEKLKETHLDSTEAAEKYAEVCNKIAEEHPDLVSGYDAEGNAIINLALAYERLKEAKLDASKSEKEEADALVHAAAEALAQAEEKLNERNIEILEGGRIENGELESKTAALLMDILSGVWYQGEGLSNLASKIVSAVTLWDNGKTLGHLLGETSTKEILEKNRQAYEHNTAWEYVYSLYDRLRELNLNVDEETETDEVAGNVLKMLALTKAKRTIGATSVALSLVSERLLEDQVNNTAKYSALKEFDNASIVASRYLSKKASEYTESDNYFADQSEKDFDDIQKEISDFWIHNLSDKRESLNNLIANLGDYTLQEAESILSNLGIKELQGDYLKIYESIMLYYANITDNTTEDILKLTSDARGKLDKNGRIGSIIKDGVKIGEELEEYLSGIPKQYLENEKAYLENKEKLHFLNKLGDNEKRAVSKFYNNILDAVNEDTISEDTGAKITKAYVDTWKYLTDDKNFEGQEELLLKALTLLRDSDFTKAEGILNFVKGLEDLGITIEGVHFDEIKFPPNFSAAVQTFGNTASTLLENFEKDMSSATKGMDFKKASDMASKLGININKFRQEGTKFYLDDYDLLELYYFEDRAEAIAELEKELLRELDSVSALNFKQGSQDLDYTLEDLLSSKEYTEAWQEKVTQLFKADDFKEYLTSDEVNLNPSVLQKEIEAFMKDETKEEDQQFLSWLELHNKELYESYVLASGDVLNATLALASLSRGDIEGFIQRTGVKKTAKDFLGLAQSKFGASEKALQEAQHLADDYNLKLIERIASGDITNLEPELQLFAELIYNTFKDTKTSLVNSLLDSLEGGSTLILVTDTNKTAIEDLAKEGWITGEISKGKLVDIATEELMKDEEGFKSYLEASNMTRKQRAEALKRWHDIHYPDPAAIALKMITSEDLLDYSTTTDLIESLRKGEETDEAVASRLGLRITAWGSVIEDRNRYIAEILSKLLDESLTESARKELAAELASAERTRDTQTKIDTSKAVSDLLKDTDQISEESRTALEKAIGVEEAAKYFKDNKDGTHKLDVAQLRQDIENETIKLSEQLRELVFENFALLGDAAILASEDAVKLVTSGTNKQQDMQKIVNAFKGKYTLAELFKYDDILKAYTLDPSFLLEYLLILAKEYADAMGVSYGEALKAVSLLTESTIASLVDIKSYLESDNLSGIIKDTTEKLILNLLTMLAKRTEEWYDDELFALAQDDIWEEMGSDHTTEDVVLRAKDYAIANLEYNNELVEKYGELIVNDFLTLSPEDILATFAEGGDKAVEYASFIAKIAGKELTAEEMQLYYAPLALKYSNMADLVAELVVGNYVGEGDLRSLLEEVGAVDASTGLVTAAVGEMVSVYQEIYERMAEDANATASQLNSVYAKMLTAQEQGDIDAISVMGDAMGMTYDTLGEMLGKYGMNLEYWLEDNAGLYEKIGAGKIRITDFTSFADQMGWQPGSEEYTSAFKSYNDSLIERNTLVKNTIKDELSGLEDIKPGDWLNLTLTEKAIKKAGKDNSKLIVEAAKSLYYALLSGDLSSIGYVQKLIEDLRSKDTLYLLNEKLVEFGAYLDDGILKLGENADVFNIAQVLAGAMELAGIDLSTEMKDMIASIMQSYSDAITKGIEGGMTNTEREDLIKKAYSLGFGEEDLSFTETAEGLLLTLQAAIELYEAFARVDRIKAKKVFESLKKTLEETNELYSDTTKLLAHIGELQLDIADASKEGNDARLKALEAELALAKQINAERLISGDADWNFMNKNALPGSFTNAVEYWQGWAGASKTLNDAALKLLIDPQSLATMFLHVYEIAEATGEAMTFMGMSTDKMSFSQLLDSLGSIIEIDTKTGEAILSALHLRELDIELGLGANGISDGLKAGAEAYAKMNAELLGKIHEFYDNLAQVKKGLKDEKIDWNEFFDSATGEFDYNKFKSKLSKNEKALKAFDDFAKTVTIDLSNLSDLLNSPNKLDATTNKTVMSIFKMMMSEDWDPTTGYLTIAEHLQTSGFEGELNLGDMQYKVSNGHVLSKADKDAEWRDNEGNTYTDAEDAFNEMNQKDLAEYAKEFAQYSRDTDTSKTEMEIPGTEYKIKVEGDHYILVEGEDEHPVNGQYSSAEEALNASKLAKIDKLGKEMKEARSAGDMKKWDKLFNELYALKNYLSDEGYSTYIKSGLSTGGWKGGAKAGKNKYGSITEEVRSKITESGWDANDLSQMANDLVTQFGKFNEYAVAEFKVKTGIDIDPTIATKDFLSINWQEYIDQLDLSLMASDVADGITKAFSEPMDIDIDNEDALNKIKDVQTKLSALEGAVPKLSIDIADNASGPLQEIIGLLSEIKSKTITVSAVTSIANGVSSLVDGIISGATSLFGGKATGTIGLANAKGTLMGELGPELVVSGGRYFVVGQSGPEMVNLADDAIVFNHLQTKSLLEKGTSSTRGRAITSEKNAVAYATGSKNGGRAMPTGGVEYASELTSAGSIIWNKGFGAIKNVTKNTDDKPLKSFLKELERWYNWLQKIAHIEKEITYLESLRTKYQSDFNRTGKEYFNSLKETLDLLQDQLVVQLDLVKELKAYLLQRLNELQNSPFSMVYRFDERGQIEYLPGAYELFNKLFSTNDLGIPYYTAELLYDALIAMGMEEYMKYDNSGQEIDKSKDGWQATAVQAFYDKMEKLREEFQKLHDDVMDGEEKLIDLQNLQNEILHEIEDNLLAVELKVLDAVTDMKLRLIDDALDLRDAIAEASEHIINGLSELLEKERKMYELQLEADELARLLRQLAIAQRSGSSAAQIADLLLQIAEKLLDMYFDTLLSLIDTLLQASDNLLERLDHLIDIMLETLDYEKEFGLLWNAVYEVLNGTPELISDFIQKNTTEYWGKSPTELTKLIREDLFDIDRMKEFEALMTTKVSTLNGGVSTLNGGISSLIASVLTFAANFGIKVAETQVQQVELLRAAEAAASTSAATSNNYVENQAGLWRLSSDGRWWYLHNTAGTDGKDYTTNNWEKINDKWYHFDNEGWMLTGWFLDTDGKWYYLDDTKGANEGAMLANTTRALSWNGQVQNHTFNGSGVWTGSSAIGGNGSNKSSYDVIYTDASGKTQSKTVWATNEADAKSLFNQSGNTIHTVLKRKKARGGYVNHGLYELGELGTETVLTASQTKVLRDNILSNRPDSLISLLKSYKEAYHGLSKATYDSISDNSTITTTTIERAEVNLLIEKLADDYDSKRAANTIMDEMLRIASKTKANNSVRR